MNGWRQAADSIDADSGLRQPFVFKMESIFRLGVDLIENKFLCILRSVGMQQPRMLTIDEVPLDVHEIAIFTRYRPICSTPQQCIASVFHGTNESLNFWTHFIPAWYFIWCLADIFQNTDFCTDPYTWAFLTFMVGGCVYLLTSCFAHVFSSLSSHSRCICYFLDYWALSLYSYVVAVLYASYSVPQEMLTTPLLREIYLSVCLLMAVFGTYLACSSRFLVSSSAMKILRLSAFCLPYMSAHAPLAYRVFISESSAIHNEALSYYTKQFIAAFLGATAYALHIPEKLAPGRFDLVGNSHQILHVASVITTYAQMQASLLDMETRRYDILANGWILHYTWTIISVIIVVAIDGVVIAIFCKRVMHGDLPVDKIRREPYDKTNKAS